MKIKDYLVILIWEKQSIPALYQITISLNLVSAGKARRGALSSSLELATYGGHPLTLVRLHVGRGIDNCVSVPADCVSINLLQTIPNPRTTLTRYWGLCCCAHHYLVSSRAGTHAPGL